MCRKRSKKPINRIGVLVHHGRHMMYAPWSTRTRRVLPGTNFSSLIAAMCVEDHYPGFLRRLL